MPLPISLAHKLAKRLADVRTAEILPYLRPDGKTQVTVRYVDGRPVEVEKVLISTQHRDGAESLLKDDLWEHVIEPVMPDDLYDARKLHRTLLVNPTGRFVIGGPMGDCGLTGRKIIVDTYGGMARHGGGAFSGKDPSKVDRSAAYAARYVAKNVVAAGLADRAEVQVAYAIGVAHPVSVMVETFGTEKIGRVEDPRADRRALRPASGRVPAVPAAAPADLPEDRRLRPLRPRGPRLHVGADRQGRRVLRAAAGRGPVEAPRGRPAVPTRNRPGWHWRHKRPRYRADRPELWRVAAHTCGWRFSLRLTAARAAPGRRCGRSARVVDAAEREVVGGAARGVEVDRARRRSSRSSSRWRELTF